MDSESTSSQGSNVSGPMQNLAVPVAIVFAGALIAGAVYMNSSQGGSPQGNTGGTQPKPVDVKDIKITADDPFIGSPTAPVTLVYWSDYQCPFCKAVEVGGVAGINIQPSLPMLIKDYVDTGKLRIVFKDFAFLGPDSTTAALYEHAVWELYPAKFYDWREAMYEAQDEEHGGFGNEESILELIETVPGLDANRLKALVVSKEAEYTAAIEADRAEGGTFDVSGTPAFITGTQFIGGAQSPSAFKAAIDAQL